MTMAELIALGGMLLSAGAALAQLATVRERVAALEQSRDKLGERIGQLEKELGVAAALMNHEMSRPHKG